jgi:outer membrane protein assembly factor BamB
MGGTMKKLQKITIILVISAVIIFTAVNYIYQRITPRALGISAFPLNEKWSQCVDENIRDISTNGNGIVFVKTRGTISAYNEDTGILMWKSTINSQRESFPPIVADERVFVTDSENLWAFELGTGKVLWKAPLDSADTWVPEASDKFVLLNSISNRVDIYDTASGKRLWETEGDRGYTKAYINQDKIYIMNNGIKVFDAVTGNLLETVDNNLKTDLSTFDNGVIYYIEYHGMGVFDGDGTYDLVAYSVKARDELWRIKFTDYDSASDNPDGLYIHDNFLFMTQLGYVYRINPENGAIKWKRKFSNPENLSVIGKNIYTLTPFEGIIHSVDIESGKDTGSLQISFYKIANTQSQRMVNTEANLVFARGCDVFVYGK